MIFVKSPISSPIVMPLSLLIPFLNPFPSAAVIHHEEKCIKARSKSIQNCHTGRFLWLVHDVRFRLSRHDRRQNWHAEMLGCSLAVHAPGSLLSTIFSSYVHAYCHSNRPKAIKGAHNVDKTIVSLLQEWACCLLPHHWYYNNTSSRWIWRNFGTWWRIFCGFSGSYFLLFGKIVAWLTWEGFYICDPNNWITQKLAVNMEHFGGSCKFPCASMVKVVVWMTSLSALVAENAWCSASWENFLFVCCSLTNT